MKLQEGRCDGGEPPGLQPEEHQRGVADSGGQAQQTADGRHGDCFAQQHLPHLPLRQPDGQQRSDLNGAAIDPQPEQQGDEHDGGGNDEETEAQKEDAERRRAFRCVQLLSADRLECEA